MQWPQHPPRQHLFKLDFKNNDIVQKAYSPYVFHMPAEIVPESFSRYKDNSSDSQYIRQKCKNHTNVSMFSTHQGNTLKRWSSKCTEHLQLIMWATLNQRLCLLLHLQTLSWSLTPYTRYGPRPETSVSSQRIYIYTYAYLHTYFFKNNVLKFYYRKCGFNMEAFFLFKITYTPAWKGFPLHFIFSQ